jgi:hypothetical protein
MLCQLWPLVVSLRLNNPSESAMYRFCTCKVAHQKYGAPQQVDCRSKMAGNGFHSFVANRSQVYHGLPQQE